MRVSQFTLASVARARRQAVVAAIARREWLLRVLGLAAAGCGPAKDRALARGNTLIVAVSDDRPLVVDAGGFEALVFLPLLKANEHGDYRACLATEWKHSADYREWTLRLRPNVRWHDGRPLTMDDVTFTLGTLSRPDNPAFGNRTESVTVHDESTFTVRGVDWPHYLEWSILPKHLCEGLDVPKFYDWDFWRHPIGCGPYRYVRDDPHTMVELEGNPDYYKGQPKIDRVVLKLSGQAGLTELLSGNVDVIELANPAELPKLANDPRFRAYYVPYRRSWVIKWQNQHPLFRDRNVRRALSLAIDRRELLQVLNLPKDFPLAEGVYTRRQFQRGEFPEAPRYDPTEAKRLLDEAGWRARASDVRERDGREFRFTSLALNERAWNETAIYVQDQLRRIGVRMELQRAERSAVGERVRAGRFEAAMTVNISLAANIARDLGPGNGLGYRDAQVDALIELARNTADPDVADQAYRQMSDILRRDQPVTFLITDFYTRVVHRRVKGMSAQGTDPLSVMEDLWLDDQSEHR